jgi:3-methyladenine DNA glycosylase AlkD
MPAEPVCSNPRLAQLRQRLQRSADPAHAEFHRGYHKSPRQFYGLRTPDLRLIFRELFPTREKLAREDALPLVAALWASPWFEENAAALLLLERTAPHLSAGDVPLLHAMTRDCDGWALLDTLSIGTLGPLALRLGDPVYEQVRGWSADPHMWTRRASILVHIVPGRKGALSERYSWPTFEDLLPERGFFIRKAIGWTLRECGRHYPEAIHDFLQRVGDRASGLTRREGARNLPPELRVPLLGK